MSGFADVPRGSRVLLTAAVLREQQAVAPIVDLQVGAARRHGSRASVPVSYALRYPGSADRRVSVDVAVHDADGGWRLDAAAVRTRLGLGSAGQRASVLGRLLPAGPVLAFPGAPPIRFDTTYLALAPSTGIVPDDTRDPVTGAALSFGVAVTATGRAAMLRAVLAGLRSCLSAAHPAPTCPLPTERYLPGSVHGRLAGAPTDVSVSLDPNAVGTLDLTADVPVTATSYRRLDFHDRVIAGRGPIALAVRAIATAHPPLAIRWLAP